MNSNIFPRLGCANLPQAVRGDGIYIIDQAGRRIMDGCSGAAASCLGHSNQAVATAIKNQVDTLAYAHTSFFTSSAAETLATQLTTAAPGNLSRAYFLSGGSEAIEAALKLVRQYHLARGDNQRRFIIGRQQSYHGNTLGALAVGNNPKRRDMFAPLLFPHVQHIAPCHYWRYGAENETAEQYGQRMADQLQAKINALGADNIAAFIAETVSGTTLGAVCAPDGYFTRIRDLCTRHGILLILDEIMCGMGRTGTLFAYEQEGITPDIVCIAKGIGAAMQPLAAMLCTDTIYNTVTQAHGGFQHGHTYIGHITACAAGVAVLQEIKQHQLLSNVCARGEQLTQLLSARLGTHPHIGDIRGRGLFIGIEFVAHNKTPFTPDKKIHATIKQTAFANGLMVYGMGGTADGEQGDHILIAPPFIITEGEVEELVDKLTQTITTVF